MICSIVECDREANVPGSARGWCSTHYSRWQRHRDPLAGGRYRRPPELTTEAEIFAWFMPGDPPPAEECWDWPAACLESGYGRFGLDSSTMVSAHIASYRIYHGPTNGLNVLHSCDRPICVQPAHLHLGTQLDNVREMIERGRMVVGEESHHAKLTEADILFSFLKTTL